jgi:hypothetical protein
VLNAIGAAINVTLELGAIAADGGFSEVGAGQAALRLGVAAGTGALGVGVGGRVAGAVVKTALRQTGGKVVASNALAGAAGGATAAAISETGLQTNQAIGGNGFDGGEVGEAFILGAAGGAVAGTITGSILQREAGQELAAAGAARLKAGPQGQIESLTGGSTALTDQVLDFGQETCSNAGGGSEC